MSSMSVFCLVEKSVCLELFFGTVGYLLGIFIVKFYFGVARRGARLAAERSPSVARAVERGAAQRCQTARAWPRAAQHKNSLDNKIQLMILV